MQRDVLIDQHDYKFQTPGLMVIRDVFCIRSRKHHFSVFSLLILFTISSSSCGDLKINPFHQDKAIDHVTVVDEPSSGTCSSHELYLISNSNRDIDVRLYHFVNHIKKEDVGKTAIANSKVFLDCQYDQQNRLHEFTIYKAEFYGSASLNDPSESAIALLKTMNINEEHKAAPMKASEYLDSLQNPDSTLQLLNLELSGSLISSQGEGGDSSGNFKPNPLLAMYKKISSTFPNINYFEPPTVDNKPSIVLTAFKKPQYLSPLVAYHLKNRVVRHPSICPGDTVQGAKAVDILACCGGPKGGALTYHLDCLYRGRWESVDNDVGKTLIKIGVYYGTLSSLANEIAKNSTLIPPQDPPWPGNRLLYLWNVYPEGKFLITEVNASLLERLAYIVHFMGNRLAMAVKNPPAFGNIYACTDEGIVPTSLSTTLPVGVEPLIVSRGDTVNNLKAVEDNSVEYSAIYLYPDFENNRSYITMMTCPSAPDGSCPKNESPFKANKPAIEDSSWIAFTKSLAQHPGKNVLPCLGADTTKGILDQPTYINDPERSSFLFYWMYMIGSLKKMEELSKAFEATPKTAEVSNSSDDIKTSTNEISFLNLSASLDPSIIQEKTDMISLVTNNVFSVTDPELAAAIMSNSYTSPCEALCKQNSPSCLTYRADEANKNGLRTLIDRLRNSQNRSISYADLLKMFNIRKSEVKRTEIKIDGENIVNSGEPAKLTLLDELDMGIYLDIPTNVQAVLSFNDEQMSIQFNENTGQLIFENVFDNQEFGGNIKSFFASEDMIYGETAKGCVQVPIGR